MENTNCTQGFTQEFVNSYCKRLIDVRKQLNEVAKKQESVAAEIEEENRALCDKALLRELNEINSVIRMYQHRLIALKREMNTLQERSRYLKDRATKLKLNRARVAAKNQ